MAKRRKSRGHKAYTRRDGRTGKLVHVPASGVQAVNTARGRVKGARKLKARADRRRGPSRLMRAEARLAVSRNQGGLRGRRATANRVLTARSRIARQRHLRARQLSARQRQLRHAESRLRAASVRARARTASAAARKRRAANLKTSRVNRGDAMIRRLLR